MDLNERCDEAALRIEEIFAHIEQQRHRLLRQIEDLDRLEELVKEQLSATAAPLTHTAGAED